MSPQNPDPSTQPQSQVSPDPMVGSQPAQQPQVSPSPVAQQPMPQPQVTPAQPANPVQPVQPVAQPMTPVQQFPGQPLDSTMLPGKKRFPTWLKIILILIAAFAVLMVGIFVSVMLATKAPQKVSDQFINDIQAGDSSAAYALTTDSFRAATSSAVFEDYVVAIKPLIQGTEKITDRSIQKVSSEASVNIFVYEVKQSDGKTVYLKTELQKDKDWKVVYFLADDQPLTTKIETE